MLTNDFSLSQSIDDTPTYLQWPNYYLMNKTNECITTNVTSIRQGRDELSRDRADKLHH